MLLLSCSAASAILSFLLHLFALVVPIVDFLCLNVYFINCRLELTPVFFISKPSSIFYGKRARVMPSWWVLISSSLFIPHGVFIFIFYFAHGDDLTARMTWGSKVNFVFIHVIVMTNISLHVCIYFSFCTSFNKLYMDNLACTSYDSSHPKFGSYLTATHSWINADEKSHYGLRVLKRNQPFLIFLTLDLGALICNSFEAMFL